MQLERATFVDIEVRCPLYLIQQVQVVGKNACCEQRLAQARRTCSSISLAWFAWMTTAFSGSTTG